jgi:hypothetical protein
MSPFFCSGSRSFDAILYGLLARHAMWYMLLCFALLLRSLRVGIRRSDRRFAGIGREFIADGGMNERGI